MLFSTSNQKDAPALSRFVARMLVTMSLTQLATPRDLLSEALWLSPGSTVIMRSLVPDS